VSQRSILVIKQPHSSSWMLLVPLQQQVHSSSSSSSSKLAVLQLRGLARRSLLLLHLLSLLTQSRILLQLLQPQQLAILLLLPLVRLHVHSSIAGRLRQLVTMTCVACHLQVTHLLQ
jgi:hypothetical protein